MTTKTVSPPTPSLVPIALTPVTPNTDLPPKNCKSESPSKKRRRIISILAASVLLLAIAVAIVVIIIIPSNKSHSINKEKTSPQNTNSTSSNTSTTNVQDDSTAALPFYTFRNSNFNWLERSNWELADGSPMNDAAHLFSADNIKVGRNVRSTPFRTRKGWAGKKIVYFEWTSNAASDTNIWMLNSKISPQFGANNGWPYLGELDLFEMFNADQALHPEYDFSGFRQFKDVASYGQMTFHMGGSHSTISPCFCPASHSKNVWYKSQEPLTSACTAQFKNTPNVLNRMAAIFDTDSSGQYIQLVQYPEFLYGKNGTVELLIGPESIATPRILNNAKMYWGIPAGQCTGGHNPTTGFPFFESFRFIVEEQSLHGSFKLQNFKVYIPS